MVFHNLPEDVLDGIAYPMSYHPNTVCSLLIPCCTEAGPPVGNWPSQICSHWSHTHLVKALCMPHPHDFFFYIHLQGKQT